MSDYEQAVFVSYAWGHGRTAVFIETIGDETCVDHAFSKTAFP